MYKLHSEDPHKYVIQHKDGSLFSVAKSAIDDGLHKKIAALGRVQKFADGGGVEDPIDTGESSQTPVTNPADQIVQQADQTQVNPNQKYADNYDQQVTQIKQNNPGLPDSEVQRMALDAAGRFKSADQLDQVKAQQSAQSDYQNTVATNAKRQAVGLAPLPLPTIQGPAPASDSVATTQAEPAPPESPGAPNPSPIGAMPGAMENLFNAQEGSVNGLNAATQAYIKNTDATAQAYQKQMQDFNALAQQHTNAAMAEADQAKQAYMTQKLDPNRVWHNMSTGNKAMATIGIILGGIGSGLTGQPNAALNVLEKMVDRDVESQKNSIGQGYNLYQMNLEKYRNQSAADSATRLQMYNAYEAQLQQQASKLTSVQAQNNANMEIQKIKLAKLQLATQFGVTMAKAQSVGALGGEGGAPVGQEDPRLMMDKDYTEHRVVIQPQNGGAARAYQYSGPAADAQAYKNMELKAGTVMTGIKQLDTLGASALVPGSAEEQTASALRSKLATDIAGLKSMQIGSKRISDVEAERAEQMISDPTKFRQAVNGGLRNQLFFKSLGDEIESSRKANLLGYRGTSNYKTFKPLGKNG